MLGKYDLEAFAADQKTKERFLENVTEVNGCWIFGNSNAKSHASFHLRRGVSIQAHRFAKIVFGQDKPEGLLACHVCLNKTCVNPCHIVWQTAQENANDRKRDGTESQCARYFKKVAKLNDAQALEIYNRHCRDGESMQSLGKSFGVSAQAVWAIVHKKSYQAVTRHLAPPVKPFDGICVRRGSRHAFSKLKDSDVLSIRASMLNGITHKDLAVKYGVGYSALRNIRYGVNWKHLLPVDPEARKKYLLSFERNSPTKQEGCR